MSQVLVIEDEVIIARSVASYLERRGFVCEVAYDAKSGLTLFDRDRPALTLLDYKLGEDDGLDVLREIRKRDPEASIVMMTGHGDISVAVDAMKNGAREFLTKPVPLATIAAVASELVLNDMSSKVEPVGPGRIIGRSAIAVKLRNSIKRLATATGSAVPPNVLVTGEQGAGKTSVAMALHESSARKAGPVNVCDLSLLGADEREPALFSADRETYFAQSEGGTLVINHVELAPPSLQTRLAQLLPDRRNQGSTSQPDNEVWVIATTSENLANLAHQGRFRSDLLYDLQVGWIDVPPLRERSSDIVANAEYFAGLISRRYRGMRVVLDTRAKAKLVEYDWPGNLTELRNTVERAVLESQDGRVEADHIQLIEASASDASATDGVPLSDLEQGAIRSALMRANGNVTKAAQLLGVTRDTLRYRIAKYRISLK